MGDAFLVTTTTMGNQSHPDVAMDYAGNFMVVWQAAEQDGDGYGIFAQRFDAGGNPVGTEFQVNTLNSGNQGVPSVAMDPDAGSVVVVWQGPDADGLGIFGQRYTANGNPLGGEFQLNTFTALDQVGPTVTMNAAGEYVVGWVSDHRAITDPTDTEKSIFVQWYSPNGQATGDEVLVHSIQPEFEAQENPDLAMDADGNFVVVWQSINQDGNTWGVFGRQFRADKTPVQPIEFQVNQTVLAPQRHPSVAVDATGNFVVGWQTHKQDASGPGVVARVYDAAAVAQTDEFLVATWEQGPQTWPVAAMTPEGNFGVFWTGHGADHAEGVHGRIYARQNPDLSVHVTDQGVPVVLGGTIVYTITYENLGNVDATGVVITQQLPMGTTFNAALSTPGWTDQGDGYYAFDVGTLIASAEPQWIASAVTIPTVAPPGLRRLFTTVSITDDGTHGTDRTFSNNVATDMTLLVKPGSVRKTQSAPAYSDVRRLVAVPLPGIDVPMYEWNYRARSLPVSTTSLYGKALDELFARMDSVWDLVQLEHESGLD